MRAKYDGKQICITFREKELNALFAALDFTVQGEGHSENGTYKDVIKLQEKLGSCISKLKYGNRKNENS